MLGPRTLLVIPPMVEVSMPYPSTAYLTGFLRGLGRHCEQKDLSLALFLRLFSRDGLARARTAIAARIGALPPAAAFFLRATEDYRRTIEPVLAFLRGRAPALALRIAGRGYLPEGRRFVDADRVTDLDRELGRNAVDERARYYASLYLYDIADAIRDGLDPHFVFPSYGESIAASAASYDDLHRTLARAPTLLDELVTEALEPWLEEVNPDLVGLTAPFPGNVFGALRAAQIVRRYAARRGRPVAIVLGGGYVNTELRDLGDPRIFELVDFLLFDDGERPILALLEHLEGSRAREDLVRAYFVEDGTVRRSAGTDPDVPTRGSPTPTYAGLDLDAYVPYSISTNPLYRMWTSYHWNKLTLAHGCYWRKCTFCDLSLDYIQRYEPDDVQHLVGKIEDLVRETGRTAFHFVDEAAPPALLRALSEEILARDLHLTWWSNVRFESYFTPEVTERYALAGCVAVTGGLEVASDRLLGLMKKGVTVAQAARAAKAFSDVGIRVHAYLMYGFPTQTLQELVDSVEIVRQLFAAGCIHTAAWHRFSATAHAPITATLPAHGIHVLRRTKDGPLFANYGLPTTPVAEFDPKAVAPALRDSLWFYSQHRGLKRAVPSWFAMPVPSTSVAPDEIRRVLGTERAPARLYAVRNA